MERPKILRLWGKADDFEIEFFNEGGTIWKVDVPPDLNDGVYAVHLTAVNELGEMATWVGELFMCGGVCCVTFEEQPYQMWLKVNNYELQFSDKYHIEVNKTAKPLYNIRFEVMSGMTISKKSGDVPKVASPALYFANLNVGTHKMVFRQEFSFMEIEKKTALYAIEFTEGLKMFFEKRCSHVR